MALKENRNQGTMVNHDEKLQHSHLHRCNHFPQRQALSELALAAWHRRPWLAQQCNMYAKHSGHAHRLSMTMWSL
jgi:hypothetical protein